MARAIVASARERGLEVPRVDDFKAIPGYGVQATVGGRQLSAGGPNLLARFGVQLGGFDAFREAAADRGQSVVYLIEGTRVLAAFALADAIRPESADAVRRLHELGLEVAMLTGDAQVVADTVARQLGIDRVFAQVLPTVRPQKSRSSSSRVSVLPWWATA